MSRVPGDINRIPSPFDKGDVQGPCCGRRCLGSPLGKKPINRFLVPTRSGLDGSEDTALIERVLATGGAFHSTPIAGISTIGIVLSLTASNTLAHHLEVEWTLTFGDRASGPSHHPLVALGRNIKFCRCSNSNLNFKCDSRRQRTFDKLARSMVRFGEVKKAQQGRNYWSVPLSCTRLLLCSNRSSAQRRNDRKISLATALASSEVT